MFCLLAMPMCTLMCFFYYYYCLIFVFSIVHLRRDAGDDNKFKCRSVLFCGDFERKTNKQTNTRHKKRTHSTTCHPCFCIL